MSLQGLHAQIKALRVGLGQLSLPGRQGEVAMVTAIAVLTQALPLFPLESLWGQEVKEVPRRMLSAAVFGGSLCYPVADGHGEFLTLHFVALVN